MADSVTQFSGGWYAAPSSTASGTVAYTDGVLIPSKTLNKSVSQITTTISSIDTNASGDKFSLLYSLRCAYNVSFAGQLRARVKWATTTGAGGAATGAEIERALVAAVRRSAAVIHENEFALDLVVEHGRCAGVRAANVSGSTRVVRSRHVLLAAGGAGQLFSVTTNPLEATGDGVAMALPWYCHGFDVGGFPSAVRL
jgi:succinate dehydrogenase/fumarate reductase flavoprotein subunit